MKNIKKIFLIFLIAVVFFIGVFGPKIYSNLFREDLLDRNTDIIEKITEPNVLNEPPVELIEEPTTSSISILAVGDIMFHSPQNKAAYNPTTDSYDYTNNFKHVKKYIEKADVAIANFETVTSITENPSGYPRFNTPKESLKALKDSGFDILSTANNHSLDKGEKGIVGTIDSIYEYEMKNIGTYKIENTPYLIEEIEGIKMGFLSYTYGLNGLDSLLPKEKRDYMINLIKETKIQKDIETLKSMEVDMIVVYLHWGHEYHREPSEYQIQLGKKMVDWGANIIFGSHPHVIQKSEIITKEDKDNFIIYSLGNFISNQRKETMGNSYTEDGVMVALEIEKDFHSNHTKIKNIEYIPTWVHKSNINGKIQYEVLPIVDYMEGRLDISLNESLKNRLTKSFKDTMDKMYENSEFQELN